MGSGPREYAATIDVPDGDEHCAYGHAKTRIGGSLTEKPEYHPASFIVIETVRASYAFPRRDGVVETAALPQAIEKSLAG